MTYTPHYPTDTHYTCSQCGATITEIRYPTDQPNRDLHDQWHRQQEYNQEDTHTRILHLGQ